MDKLWHVEYDGFDLEIKIRRWEEDHFVKCNFQTKGQKYYKDAYSSIFRFFNELVWFHDLKIHNINGGHSQGVHVFLNYKVSDAGYLLKFKQRVNRKDQHLALAFFREAECNESPFYRFICFAKILEIPFKGNQHKIKKEWMERNLNELKSNKPTIFRDARAVSFSNGSSDWFQKFGRHAIAHARQGEIIRDPNNYDDWQEIVWANSVMQELAEKLIIEKLEVPTRNTI